jgi:hypothetical protein
MRRWRCTDSRGRDRIGGVESCLTWQPLRHRIVPASVPRLPPRSRGPSSHTDLPRGAVVCQFPTLERTSSYSSVGASLSISLASIAALLRVRRSRVRGSRGLIWADWNRTARRKRAFGVMQLRDRWPPRGALRGAEGQASSRTPRDFQQRGDHRQERGGAARLSALRPNHLPEPGFIAQLAHDCGSDPRSPARALRHCTRSGGGSPRRGAPRARPALTPLRPTLPPSAQRRR